MLIVRHLYTYIHHEVKGLVKGTPSIQKKKKKKKKNNKKKTKKKKTTTIHPWVGHGRVAI